MTSGTTAFSLVSIAQSWVLNLSSRHARNQTRHSWNASRIPCSSLPDPRICTTPILPPHCRPPPCTAYDSIGSQPTSVHCRARLAWFGTSDRPDSSPSWGPKFLGLMPGRYTLCKNALQVTTTIISLATTRILFTTFPYHDCSIIKYKQLDT
jgi:hypothetical protein